MEKYASKKMWKNVRKKRFIASLLVGVYYTYTTNTGAVGWMFARLGWQIAKWQKEHFFTLKNNEVVHALTFLRRWIKMLLNGKFNNVEIMCCSYFLVFYAKKWLWIKKELLCMIWFEKCSWSCNDIIICLNKCR